MGTVNDWSRSIVIAELFPPGTRRLALSETLAMLLLLLIFLHRTYDRGNTSKGMLTNLEVIEYAPKGVTGDRNGSFL